MGETVDVLVIGRFLTVDSIYLNQLDGVLAGNYGNRKRGGGVSTLICGVVDDRWPDHNEETM
jgi:hypothetical protein